MVIKAVQLVVANNPQNLQEVWEGDNKGKKFRIKLYWTSGDRKDIPSGINANASSLHNGNWVSTSIVNDPGIPNGKKLWQAFAEKWASGKSLDTLKKICPEVKWTFVKYGPGGA
jgi:hypothetical protein